MRVLIVDNNLHIKGYPQGLMVRCHLPLRDFLSATIVRADRIEKKHYGFDKVILTGSAAYVRQKEGWMAKEWDLIGHCQKKKIPVLGVCFGSQMLSVKIFGEDSVQAMPVPISGSMEFRQMGNSPLFSGLPRLFGVVSTHYEATYVPVRYSIGEAEMVKTYAYFYPPCFYGIQFHPELMGLLGRNLVRLQKMLYDRLVYQDFSVRTGSAAGRKIYSNFIWL